MNAKPETQNITLKGASYLHNDCISGFKIIRAENFDYVIVRTLNMNSISSKFDEFKLMVSDGYSIPYKSDRNRNGEALMIYVRDDIPSKMLTKYSLLEDIEAAFIDLNLKWEMELVIVRNISPILPKS